MQYAIIYSPSPKVSTAFKNRITSFIQTGVYHRCCIALHFTVYFLFFQFPKEKPNIDAMSVYKVIP